MSASNYFVFANLVRAWPDAKLAFSGGSGALLSPVSRARIAT
jgi:hypothetical protein